MVDICFSCYICLTLLCIPTITETYTIKIKTPFDTMFDGDDIFNMIVYGVGCHVIALSLFFIAPLAFSSSPSHSLLIRERLILCSCCQQEPLSSSSQIHSQDDSPLLMSALKPTPPPFTCPSLCSPPLSPCSEPSHLPPLMCPPCMLFSLIPGFHFFPSHVMGYYFLGCKMDI